MFNRLMMVLGLLFLEIASRFLPQHGLGQLPSHILNSSAVLLDVINAGVWILLAIIVSRFSSLLLFILLAIVWPLAHWPNMESIFALGQPIDLADIHYVSDANFLKASVSVFGFPIFYICSFSAMVAVWFSLNKAPIKLALKWLILPVLGLVSLGVFLQMYLGDWNRGHPLYWTVLSGLNNTEDGKEKSTSRPMSGPDVGIRNEMEEWNTSGQARNVLLVVLEGIPGAYVTSVRDYFDLRKGSQREVDRFFMPELSGVAATGQLTPSFIAHSRQTIRGLYSMLCGDYSKLSASTPKAQEYVQLSQELRPKCLPEILGDAGYRSIYLQAAPLGFMSKDRFMEAVGFNDVYGDKWFEPDGNSFVWGIDDKGFFEQSIGLIKQLNQQSSPWFLTLLTVGTHHPYDVSSSEEAGYPNRKLAAVAKLDKAVGYFMREIKKMGVNDNTLIIFTSDESHEVPGHPHGGSWGLNIALAPDIPAGIKEGDYALLDTAISILDYLGLASRGDHIQGRSLFQNYSNPRTIMFHRNALFSYQQGRGVIRCFSPKNCVLYEPENGRMFAQHYKQSKVPSSRSSELELLWQRATISNASLSRHSSFDKFILVEDKTFSIAPSGTTLIDSGQYLTVPANQQVTIELELYNASETALILPYIDWRAATKPESAGSGELEVPVVLPLLSPGAGLELKFSMDSGKYGWVQFDAAMRSAALGEMGSLLVKRFVVHWQPQKLPQGFNLQRFVLKNNKGRESTATNTGKQYLIPFVYELNSDLMPNSASNGSAILISGWSQPEVWGVWSVEDYATVGFLIDAPKRVKGGYQLDLKLRAYVNEMHPFQPLKISINGQLLGEYRFNYEAMPEKLRLEIPADFVRQGFNQIAFGILNSVSPMELGRSKDGRTLGIGIESLNLKTLEHSPTQAKLSPLSAAEPQ